LAANEVRIREGFRLGLAHLGYAAIAFVFLLPLWWAVVSSLRPNASVFADVFPFTAKALAPSPASLEAYEDIVQAGFGSVILNTLLVAAITFDFRGKRIILSLVILSFMLPFEAIALPLYNVMRQLGWLDSIAALVVPGVTNGLVVFLFYQFFRQIPRDYVEAARLDGVSWTNIMLRIYVPLSLPTCVSAALLLFVFQWEAFLWPLLAMPSQDFKVIQVGMAAFQQQYGTIWNQLFAVAAITALIPIALLLPLQRYYVQGLSGAGIKG
jgi:ABC-type glycerol-3-phosphate transport system permease component